MNNRYYQFPDGNEYRDYLTQAQTDNEYIINYNINNIRYLYFHLTAVEDWIDNLPDVSDLSGYYTKDQVDTLLTNYYTKEVIDDTFSLYYKKDETDLLLDNFYTKEVIDDTFSLYYNKEETDLLLDNKVDLTEYNQTINEIETNVGINTQAINTLNDIVSANFETFGRYNIQGMSLSDTAGEVRFILVEKIKLDSQYINVSLNPNQFINLVSGKITFNIIADGIINNEVEDLTIELKIYKNGTILDGDSNESKVIEAGTSSSINFAGTFDVQQNDTIYATLEIINGDGVLTTNNPVIINVDFKSDNIQQAIKSDQVVNTYQDLPNNGINPQFVRIDVLEDVVNTLLPIGMIVMSPVAPNIGTWIDLGLLNDGQSIIGGNDSNGEVISHNHQWLRNAKKKAINGGGDAHPLVSLSSFGIDDGNITIEDTGGNGSVSDYFNDALYTKKVGGETNRAYGKGIGNDIHIWKRES